MLLKFASLFMNSKKVTKLNLVNLFQLNDWLMSNSRGLLGKLHLHIC